jgi:hypothetical protein
VRLYRSESSDPKRNAQQNLTGRTHYVDDDTLKFFSARVLSFRIHAGGLLCSLVESVKGPDGPRIFRGVIFGIDGNTIYRPSFDESFRNREQAEKAMYKALDEIDAVKVTQESLKTQFARAKREYAEGLVELKAKAAELKALKAK